MFNLKTPAATEAAIVSAKDIRQASVEAAFVHVAKNLHSGTYTRDNAVKALQPVMDSLHTGQKVKGHAEMVKQLVQDNLDSALEAMSNDVSGVDDTLEGEGEAKGKRRHKAA